MAMTEVYESTEPTRESIDARPGLLVLEFGTAWCGYCRAAQPLIAQALKAHPAVDHMKIEDGSGRLLGRSFRIKLWPSLIFLRDGQEVARLVRPGSVREVEQALQKLVPPQADPRQAQVGIDQENS